MLFPCCVCWLVSPLLGYLLVLAMDNNGVLAQSMVIGVATPTAVNTAILHSISTMNRSMPYFITLLSPVSLTAVIYLATRYL